MHSLLDENERKRNLNLSKEVVLRTNEVSVKNIKKVNFKHLYDTR